MKKKVILIIIISIMTIMIAVMSHISSKNKYTEEWLVCNNTSAIKGYKEVIKFRYTDNILYGFYRDEEFDKKELTDIDRVLNYFNEMKENMENTSNIVYDIDNQKKKIYIKTYIGVKKEPEFYNNYIINKDLSDDSKIETAKKVFEKEKYECKITKK